MKKAGSPPCRKYLILLVEQRGIEPLTSALRTRRSAKLSYCPIPKCILGSVFDRVKIHGTTAGLASLKCHGPGGALSFRNDLFPCGLLFPNSRLFVFERSQPARLRTYSTFSQSASYACCSIRDCNTRSPAGVLDQLYVVTNLVPSLVRTSTVVVSVTELSGNASGNS